jgi:hypothetical protein
MSPVVDGWVRSRALETLDQMVSVLAGIEPPDASLAGGSAGFAILYAYLDEAFPATGHAQTARRHLESAVQALKTVRMGPSLYSGFLGVAWAMAHLQGRVVDPLPDRNGAVDRALIGRLRRTPWRGDYDLINGLVGFGVYGLERLPRSSAQEILELVVERLAATAERTEQGATWVTRAEQMPPEFRHLYPPRFYNLGLAHGVPGVLALLGAVCAAGVATDTARPLLDEAAAWLLAQRLDKGAEARFPTWRVPDQTPVPARSAWCYGDPGVAAALLIAGRCAGQSAWEREAVELARGAARRSPDRSGVVDAGLCHGAAGLAHIFHRMYLTTGDAQLGEAARLWFRRTLEMRQQREIAGFPSRGRAPDGGEEWTADPRLLTGVAGIALALAAATTGVGPSWDRMLLVSAGPESRRHSDES